LIKNLKRKINSLEFEKRPFINGEYVESISKVRIKKVSPADGRDISGLRSCNLDDIDEAYQSTRLLQAGIIHVNSYGEDDNMVPFGG